MVENNTNPILQEITNWQTIYEWFERHGTFGEEAKHVKSIISAITLGIKLNPQGPSQ